MKRRQMGLLKRVEDFELRAVYGQDLSMRVDNPLCFVDEGHLKLIPRFQARQRACAVSVYRPFGGTFSLNAFMAAVLHARHDSVDHTALFKARGHTLTVPALGQMAKEGRGIHPDTCRTFALTEGREGGICAVAISHAFRDRWLADMSHPFSLDWSDVAPELCRFILPFSDAEEL